MSEIIQLTEHSRLRIVTDESAENPRGDWDSMLTGFVKIPGRGDSRLIDVLPVYQFPGNIQAAVDALEGPHYARGWTDAIERWARIFHGLHIEYDHEHGGYWFVDPVNFELNFPASPTGNVRQMLLNPLAEASEWRIGPRHYVTWVPSLDVQAQIIKQEREIYRMWAESEVSGVILEHLTEWVLLSRNEEPVDPPERRQQWEPVESLYGCYLTDDWTAQMVALDSFELTNAEIDALR